MAGRNNALARPLHASGALAAIVGDGQVSRTRAVKTVWSYIKANDLQDPRDRREILADSRLEALVGSQRVSMLDLSRFIAAHLTEAGPQPGSQHSDGGRPERETAFRVLVRVKEWLPARTAVA